MLWFFAVTVVLAGERRGEGADVRISAEGKETEWNGAGRGKYIKILEAQGCVDLEFSPLE